ncbi:hypothetical protein Cgig2_000026 [Carnegiea gigantea]|uniref:Uncharacterized protein n=1 Tax=Carnegiea gigantea TaxID=171969 RepID=A0A9Q1KZ58_9CARY|nr:hypothetical protein Cgig2_000026 [Carnegiea gigantea]
MATRDKILKELEGDTYMLYSLSLNIKCSKGVKQLKNLFAYAQEHIKGWQEYITSQPSTNDSSQSPPLSESIIWVQGNLISKGCVYGFGVEGVVMKRQSRLSVSTRSSSINNYNALSKAVEDTRQEEFRKDIEEEVRAKLIVEFNNKWGEKEAKIGNDPTQEKAARQ